jgi:hypothetical protein
MLYKRFYFSKINYNNDYKPVKDNPTMAEQEIDVNFNPQEFLVPENWFIDGTFWEHIDQNMSVPSVCKTKFYIPQKRAKKSWPEKLKQFYGIEPQAVYETSVLNLPNEITAEEIETHRRGMNKYLVKSIEDPTPIGPPDKLSVQNYLRSKRMELIGKLSFTTSEEQTKRIWDRMTEKEKRIYRWTKDYGFLWDHREGKGVLFSEPKGIEALKFETTCEYFFHLPDFPLLILSVGCEPNTDKAIYGFRREARLDWPFDKIWTGVEHDENGKPRPRYIDTPEKAVEQNIVLPMNRLIQNLEYILTN